MELRLRIDDKGRILIPAHIRKKLGLKRIVKISVEEDRLIIEAIKDPIETLTSTVIKGSKDIEKEIPEFRKIAEEESLTRVREEW